MKNQFIQFQENKSESQASEFDKSIIFNEVVGEIASDNLKQKKSNTHKKQKLSTNQERIKIAKQSSSCYRFNLSISLINLLRQPFLQNHDFQQEYLQKIKRIIMLANIPQSYVIHYIYLHIIMAQVQNIEQLEFDLDDKDNEIVKLNINEWNRTNILNAHCILENICNISEFKISSNDELVKSVIQFDLVKENSIAIVIQKQMKISISTVQIALQSYGHLDIYFGPFLVQKFQTDLVYRCLYSEQEAESLNMTYAKIFSQICLDYTNSNIILTQAWYQNQLQKLINDQFVLGQIEQLVNSGVKNRHLQKFLIGLLGWKSEVENANRLLNCYYDSCDWHLNDPSRAIISQTGEHFNINYLIQNNKQHRNYLVICVRGPCLNSNFNHQVFSFHKPKLNQYITDDESYLWVQHELGKFTKCGYYDWIFFLAKQTKKQFVYKIIDVQQNKKWGSQIFKKNFLNVKNVKGRFIVHPENTRKMQIHQIFIDSISSDEGLYRTPNFSDAQKQIEILKNNGVNVVYLAGVFQRDNGEFPQGFKRPQASSVAFTSRIEACSMLGGQKQLKKIINNANKKHIKIILDCTTRVSASRMNRIYEKLSLKYVDDSGKKNTYYGSEGRSINYNDTAVLNYRKQQAWNLLLQETLEVIQNYKINGIYLDNGIVWPQIFQTNKQQLGRMQKGRLTYTHQEIFQGVIINPNKKGGYWNSKNSNVYPNPFYVYLCKNIWARYPNFLIISQANQPQNSFKFINIINSGPIPRLFKLPKALSQIVGLHLHENGSLSQTPKKTITKLSKWYQQTKRILPKKCIMIQSTTSQIYPYPALIFKKATWVFIDLFFFLPQIPMTFSKQHQGRAYRTKALNFYYDTESYENKSEAPSQLTKSIAFSKAQSTFFQPQMKVSKKQKYLTGVNSTIRDLSQIKYLQQNFRKEVGPQFGFDLGQIHKHYLHRRQLRQKYPVLVNNNMIPLSAEHMYGIHTNVLSFAKWDQEQILLISINFHSSAIDMHYNLSSLKVLFRDIQKSKLTGLVQDIFQPTKFTQEYYTIDQLIYSKIQEHIQAFKSSIWRIKILSGDQYIKKAYRCSEKRVIQKINKNPPQWIYSSIFTNQLSRLITNSKTIKPFVNGLTKLYNQFILPNNINFNLVISKTNQFYIHKVKLQKLFGIFKLLQNQQNNEYYKQFDQTLKLHIKNLLMGNMLGPIAFVTPQIGAWSSVGGLGVMVDQLTKELAKLGQQVYIITPYYQYNKKKETGYLERDGFNYNKNIKVFAAHFESQFGIHTGKYCGVNYIWFHNPQLFSRPYDGQGALYVTRQLVFFATICLQTFCQLKIFPSIIVTNDWMCGFVSAYVKVHKFKEVFNGSKFMHICHNLDPLYQGRIYPKSEQGDLNWLVQLPRQWYVQFRNNKTVINPSRCALQTCDNWGTVSNSYKYDLLKQSPLSSVLWKHPLPFSFPNGVRKEERLSIIYSKTPGNHSESKKLLQQKYFGLQKLNDQIPLFAFIGRVTKQKGVHLILDAIQSLLYQTNFKIQFLIGGPSDSKEDYGKYCADKMKVLTHKYSQCVWSNPDAFFTDGALVNIGSDFAMMPSQFQPGGIVQHQFFSGSTPVVAFRTGGLKDTVFQFDVKNRKGNGFNFMSHQVQDFKRCMRRAVSCYKNKQAYTKLRQNAFQSVIQEEDVAKGWNNQFYRMQNKIYIDWDRVQKQIQTFTKKIQKEQQNVNVLQHQTAEFWKNDWQVKKGFKEVLKNASRLKVKSHDFCFETDKIPRPKEILVSGTWNDWKENTKLNFDKIHKNWKISIKLKPGSYHYKYLMDGEWMLTKDQPIEADINGIENHVAIIQ